MAASSIGFTGVGAEIPPPDVFAQPTFALAHRVVLGEPLKSVECRAGSAGLVSPITDSTGMPTGDFYGQAITQGLCASADPEGLSYATGIGAWSLSTDVGNEPAVTWSTCTGSLRCETTWVGTEWVYHIRGAMRLETNQGFFLYDPVRCEVLAGGILFPTQIRCLTNGLSMITPHV